MKFNELNIKPGKKPTRKGRGISAGEGKTAGRGTKGQGARKSGGVRPGFEGGQMPLYMRIPKLRGFTSHRPKTIEIYTGQLESVKSTVINNQSLTEAGLVSSPYTKIKLISNGDIKRKLSVKLQSASKEAIKQIEKAGGQFEKIDQIKRQVKQPQKEN